MECRSHSSRKGSTASIQVWKTYTGLRLPSITKSGPRCLGTEVGMICTGILVGKKSFNISFSDRFIAKISVPFLVMIGKDDPIT